MKISFVGSESGAGVSQLYHHWVICIYSNCSQNRQRTKELPNTGAKVWKKMLSTANELYCIARHWCEAMEEGVKHCQ
jgi:hypothetical protein